MYAQGMPQAKQHSSPLIVLSMLATVLAALFFAGMQYVQSNELRAADPLVPSYADVQGDDDARISIVVFGDFRCVECAELAREVLPGIQADFIDDGTVSLVYRHYPVLGRDSMRAAVAAECAGQQGKFWKMHDVLFAWQGGAIGDLYTDEMLKQLALGIRVNHQEFTACLKDESTTPMIATDITQGNVLQLRDLPAVFVNGVSAGPSADDTRIRALVIAAAKAL